MGKIFFLGPKEEDKNEDFGKKVKKVLKGFPKGRPSKTCRNIKLS